MGGHITFPGFAICHATKWGVEGYFEALATEVAPFGIRTMVVEPGMVRTSFYESAQRVPVSEPYRGGPADTSPPPVDSMPGSLSGVANAVVNAVLADAPPLRLLPDSDAYELVTNAAGAARGVRGAAEARQAGRLAPGGRRAGDRGAGSRAGWPWAPTRPRPPGWCHG